jgi:hypothetical protein
MAWESPAEDRPVWCTVGGEKDGVPTAQSVNCVTKNPSSTGAEVASLQMPLGGAHGLATDAAAGAMPVAPVYKKFTSQDELGHFLVDHYKIRNPKDLTSCEVCHR